jgi:hypothetical protein
VIAQFARAAAKKFREVRFSSRVGINLGIVHQQVYVASTSQHVIEAAVAKAGSRGSVTAVIRKLLLAPSHARSEGVKGSRLQVKNRLN